MIVDPLCLGSSKAKSPENTPAKSAYLAGTFVGASLAIKPAIGWILSRGELGNATELTDPT